MRGISAFVVLLLAVSAHAQGPQTRTKKGPPPSRRGDNTDRGLPSGADVPDGRRFAPPAGRAAPPPAARVAVPPAGRAAPPQSAVMPVAAGAPPPAGAPPAPFVRQRPAAAVPPPRGAGGPPPRGAGGPPPARPVGRPGDNTDRGLPSGADVPDGRRMPVTRTRSGPRPVRRMPPVYRVPAQAPAAPVMKPAPMFNPWAPVAPVAPAAPFMSCEASCPVYWQPVCSVYGNSYDNECRLRCSGEPYSCEGQCPCEEPKAPAAPIVDPFMGLFDACNCPATYEPVCTESGDDKDNACIARCDGHKVNCEGTCPC